MERRNFIKNASSAIFATAIAPGLFAGGGNLLYGKKELLPTILSDLSLTELASD